MATPYTGGGGRPGYSSSSAPIRALGLFYSSACFSRKPNVISTSTSCLPPRVVDGPKEVVHTMQLNETPRVEQGFILIPVTLSSGEVVFLRCLPERAYELGAKLLILSRSIIRERQEFSVLD
jgi:hypothetical protein